MDEVVIENNYAFGRVNNTFIALIGRNKLEYLPYNKQVADTAYGKLSDSTKHFDLIQKGRNSFWIYELSIANDESFEEFKNRIKNNRISYINKKIIYQSKKTYEAKYGEFFIVDDKVINTIYNGYQSNDIKDKEDGIYINDIKVVQK